MVLMECVVFGALNLNVLHEEGDHNWCELVGKNMRNLLARYTRLTSECLGPVCDSYTESDMSKCA